jgi:hypothetical protein
MNLVAHSDTGALSIAAADREIDRLLAERAAQRAEAAAREVLARQERALQVLVW